MTNFEECCEWMKSVNQVAYELYKEYADVTQVNDKYSKSAISIAFGWDEVGNGYEYWAALNDKWIRYLESGYDQIIKKEPINPSHYNENKDHDVYSFVHNNQLGMLEGNVIKYVARHKKKNGKEDLLKAIETLNRLIELEY